MFGLFKKTDLTIDLSDDAPSLVVPSLSKPINLTVDGSPAEFNHAQIIFPFSKGRHTLSYITKIPDQTKVELKNKTEIKQTLYKMFVREYFEISSPVALKSYSFYLPIILNDAEDVVVYSTTGHTIKHKFEFGRLWINIKNLLPTIPAEIQISYEINNISSYLTDQIEVLQQDNLTDDERSKLKNICEMIERGDYENALKETHKLQEDIKKRKRREIITKEEIGKKVNELTAWQKQISMALNKTTSKEFEILFDSEKEKIEDILTKANSSELNKALDILESYSAKSFIQTMNKKRKEMEKENEELKEWFVNNAIDNDSVWKMFDEIDGLLVKHEVNPKNLNVLIEAHEKISKLKEIKHGAEEKIRSEKSKLINELSTILSSIEPLKEAYARTLKSAKGTPYAKYFDFSEKETNKVVMEGEKLKTSADVVSIKKINDTIEKLKALKEGINRSLGGLRELFITRLERVKQTFKDKKRFLSPDQINSIEQDIEKSEEMMEEGKIIDAHLNLDKLEAKISHLVKEQHNNNYVLLITGILLFVAMVYYLKDSDIFSSVFRKEEKKEKPALRRLKKIGDG
jgi:hypothetical protein